MTEQRQIIHVVDDDEAMRDSMTWLLEGEGYQVACFDSAETFLKAYRRNMRGCLVLDVRMPEMSGLELHEKLDSLGSQLPVIFVTGHGDVPMAVGALQRGSHEREPFGVQLAEQGALRAAGHFHPVEVGVVLIAHAGMGEEDVVHHHAHRGGPELADQVRRWQGVHRP